MPFIEFDEAQFAEIADSLGAVEGQVRKAFTEALNRVASALTQRFAKELAAEAGIGKSAFQAHRTITTKATGARQKANIWVGVDMVSLRHYRVRQAADGVVARLGKSGNVFIRHAFMTKKFGGNVFVRRKYSSQLPPGIVDSGNSFGLKKVSRIAYDWSGAKHGEKTFADAVRAAAERLPLEFTARLSHFVESGKFK
jgi:hypothetical protein